jgi:hypothetical protein
VAVNHTALHAVAVLLARGRRVCVRALLALERRGACWGHYTSVKALGVGHIGRFVGVEVHSPQQL